jgi:perosamine synthetase
MTIHEPKKVFQNLHINFSQDDLDAVVKSFNPISFSGKSPILKDYESVIAEYFGTRHALACCNGTVAIELALRAVGVKQGDYVALPPTAPIMTILPILTMGAIPLFCDIRADDFGTDLNSLAAAANKPKALIVVPMWGYPLEMESIAAYCGENGIALIEDCAHSFGTKAHGKYLGTFGTASTFSTHERKLVSTGEGGLCLTNSEAVQDAMLSYMHHGLAIGKAGGAYILGEHLGTNYKLAPMCAALGINQFGKLDAKIAARRERVHQLRKMLSDLPGIAEFHRFEGEEINGYSMVWRATDGDAVERAKALNALGIISDTVRYGYKPLYREPAFAAYAQTCPNAEATIRSIFTLPCHEGLGADDLDYIVSTTRDIFS